MDDNQLSPRRVGWLTLRAFGYGLGKSSCPASMISGHDVQARAWTVADAIGLTAWTRRNPKIRSVA
jgi:hypothetical protein